MWVIDWNSTCGSPIECTRNRSKDEEIEPASIEGALLLVDLPRAIFPRRRIVCPATTEHRRDDVDFRELLGLELEGVAVEDDEVGEIAGQELAAAVLVPREPRGIDRCCHERLVERQPLFGMP